VALKKQPLTAVGDYVRGGGGKKAMSLLITSCYIPTVEKGEKRAAEFGKPPQLVGLHRQQTAKEDETRPPLSSQRGKKKTKTRHAKPKKRKKPPSSSGTAINGRTTGRKGEKKH